jgi:hypothetical protein
VGGLLGLDREPILLRDAANYINALPKKESDKRRSRL